MDVLNSIALPQSTEHFHLLLFIYNLVMAMAVPYLALLTGTILFVVWTERRHEKGRIGHGLRVSRQMLDWVLPTRSVYLFLGLLPALAMVFVHAQLFQGTSSLATSFSAFGVLFLIAAGIAAFSYIYAFRIEEAFAGIKGDGTAGTAADELLAGARKAQRRNGTTAAWTILAMAFSFSVAQAITMNPKHWRDIDSVFAALLSLDVWVWLLLFLSLSAAITGAGLLFFQHKRGGPAGEAAADGVPHGGAYSGSTQTRYAGATGVLDSTGDAGSLQDGKADSERTLGEEAGIRMSTVALLVAPLLVLLSLVRLPESAASGWVYVLAAVAVLFLFAALHALYACVRLKRWSSSAYLFATVVLATTALVTRDQVVLHNVTKDHAYVLAQVYDRSEEELKSALGVVAKQLTGEDIYNAKCSACHLFDQKRVGPAYQAVLPKYRENKAGLVAFILNPVKVDPAFPPMPSQGLKPSEADSIAAYLLQKLGAKGS